MKYLVLFTLITAAGMAQENIDALWNWNDAAASEQRFRERLTLAAEKNEPAEFRAEIMTQIARSLALQRRFDDAHKLLDEIVSQNFLDHPSPLAVRYYLERGRVYNSSDKKDLAIQNFEKALSLAQDLKLEFYAVDAAHMLGIASPPEKALEWNMKAMEMAESSDDPRTKCWLGPLYNNTGWTYYDMKEYDKALALFRKDVIYRTSNNRPQQALIARYSEAKTLRALGKIDEALTIQRTNEQQIKDSGWESDGYVYEEIAECLYEKKDTNAKVYFKKAYDLLSQDIWLSANEKDRLERLQKLSQ
jgi:tetratricopeptide (TPR) repeat protein